MKRATAFLVPMLLASLGLSACTGVAGSGVSATQTRDLGEFHALRIVGSSDVRVQVGEAQSVAVTADDNLIGDLTTDVENGVLVVSTRSNTNLSFRVSPTVNISVPNLDAVFIEGSGSAQVEALKADSFRGEILGSGNLKVSGRAAQLTLRILGSGDADLSTLECENAEAAITGSGDARLACSQSLDVKITGSGDVTYAGSPKTTKKVITGSGSVSPAR